MKRRRRPSRRKHYHQPSDTFERSPKKRKFNSSEANTETDAYVSNESIHSETSALTPNTDVDEFPDAVENLPLIDRIMDTLKSSYIPSKLIGLDNISKRVDEDVKQGQIVVLRGALGMGKAHFIRRYLSGKKLVEIDCYDFTDPFYSRDIYIEIYFGFVENGRRHKNRVLLSKLGDLFSKQDHFIVFKNIDGLQRINNMEDILMNICERGGKVLGTTKTNRNILDPYKSTYAKQISYISFPKYTIKDLSNIVTERLMFANAEKVLHKSALMLIAKTVFFRSASVKMMLLLLRTCVRKNREIIKNNGCLKITNVAKICKSEIPTLREKLSSLDTTSKLVLLTLHRMKTVLECESYSFTEIHKNMKKLVSETVIPVENVKMNEEFYTVLDNLELMGFIRNVQKRGNEMNVKEIIVEMKDIEVELRKFKESKNRLQFM